MYMHLRNYRKEMKPQATANGLEPIQQEPNIVVRYLVIARLPPTARLLVVSGSMSQTRTDGLPGMNRML